MYIFLSLLICVVGAFVHVSTTSWKQLGLVMFGVGLLVFLMRFSAETLHVFGR
jgi:hypothetical protein